MQERIISYVVDTNWAKKAQEQLKVLGSDVKIKATESSVTIDGKNYRLPKALKEPHSSRANSWNGPDYTTMSIKFDDRIQEALSVIIRQIVNVDEIYSKHRQLMENIAELAPRHDKNYSWLNNQEKAQQWVHDAKAAAEAIQQLLDNNKTLCNQFDAIQHLWSRDYTKTVKWEETK